LEFRQVRSAAMSGRPFPLTWKGWYEGEKRPHRHIHAEITILTNTSSGGELLISIYDDYLAYVAAPSSLVARMYRGYEFPRQRVLKPNNEPVAPSGTLLAGDLVVGNKLVVEAGRPPIVLLVAPDVHDLNYGRSKGVEYAHQPPDIGFNDAGVPEWPDDEVSSGGDGAEVETTVEATGEPQSVPPQAASRSAGDSDPSAGAGTADGGAPGADPE